MILLIGGAGYTGKTLMAQALLEKYNYPYLSIDHLKMGLFQADIGCGFSPSDSFETIGEALWPVLKGMLVTAVENKQNLIMEGVYLLPGRVCELEQWYPKEILSLYLGFSEAYIKRQFSSHILRHQNAIETRKYDSGQTAADYIKETLAHQALCRKYDAVYFEIHKDYQAETEAVYTWIDRQICGRTS